MLGISLLLSVELSITRIVNPTRFKTAPGFVVFFLIIMTSSTTIPIFIKMLKVNISEPKFSLSLEPSYHHSVIQGVELPTRLIRYLNSIRYWRAWHRTVPFCVMLNFALRKWTVHMFAILGLLTKLTSQTNKNYDINLLASLKYKPS